MKKLGNKLSSLLLILACIAIVCLCASNAYQIHNGALIPMHGGWGTVTVVSGSMEPGIPIGSLLLIQEQSEYMPGEIVTYANSEGYSITHRIVSIEDGTVVTRGDSNNMSDPAFPKDQIIGKVQYVLPSVGAVLLFMKQPFVLGALALISVIVFMLPIPLGKKRNAADQANLGPESTPK